MTSSAACPRAGPHGPGRGSGPPPWAARGAMSARRSAPTGATASASRRWPPPPGRSSSPSPSFGPGRSSRPCSTRAGGWTRPRCAVICSARSRGGLHPQGRRPGAGPGQRVGDLQVHGLADLQGDRRGRARVPVPPPGPHLVPLPVRRRHLPGRESGAPGGLPGAGGGHRRVGRRASGDPGDGPGGRRDHRFPDVLVLRSLRERGLKVPSPEDPTGVVLVTSDAHAGIRAAVRAILPGAAWQRCRAPLRPQHHHPGWARPDPSPSTRSSRPSSPRPAGRRWRPSTSTSSTP